MTRLRESLIVVTLALLVAIVCTWPMAARLGSMGRVDTGDGRWSIWVVAWVAHALSSDPATLYDANIFYPERRTLAYSEANIGAGLLGLPAWIVTGNPYAAHNLAVLLGFVLSTITMYALARRLTGHRGAAAVAAVLFAYCPFVFARTAHIQLLLIWGLPLVMLCLHRLVDRSSPSNAVALALALVGQALSCAYYGVFAGLIVACGVLGFSVSRGLWRSPAWWRDVTLAAALAIGLTVPFFLPYLDHQQATGFARSIEESARYSADWRAWFVSSAWAHRWIQPLLVRWNEVLFPGFLATALGLTGIWLALGPRRVGSAADGSTALPRDVVIFYVALLVVSVWISFGPDTGLYKLLATYMPVFSFLRAPARFGIGAPIALAVFSAATVAWLARRTHQDAALPAVLVVLALAELFTGPLPQPPALRPFAAHRQLARLPWGPVVELPFYERAIDFHRHTEYMLQSTAHWRPLVNGYSDYASPQWIAHAQTFRQFPAGGAMALARELGVRYVVLHEYRYSRRELAIVRQRLAEVADQLRLLIADEGVELYEIRSTQ